MHILITVLRGHPLQDLPSIQMLPARVPFRALTHKCKFYYDIRIREANIISITKRKQHHIIPTAIYASAVVSGQSVIHIRLTGRANWGQLFHGRGVHDERREFDTAELTDSSSRHVQLKKS